ncbi:MAG: S-adenosylmethionine:tRNA ribosyltransferase-isomerase [Bacteroidia bacterium]|nr:S-adenosylmethionine:tRNA ribosyltransferase-isomerase [Bacteroidia bacterium]
MTDFIKNIKINDYVYPLPAERIAKYPLTGRDRSKLLIYKDRRIAEDTFINIHFHIPEGSLLVFNNTRVIQARLIFHKPTGAQIEIFCLEPLIPPDYELNFQQKKTCIWKCITGNLKKWKDTALRKTITCDGKDTVLEAQKISDHQTYQEISFNWDNPEIPFSDILDLAGETPLPPYIDRKAEPIDKERYQTVYSKSDGSVAAPTAGLHFTKNVFDSLKTKGIKTEELTLHVGAGTFKPIKSCSVYDHEMHTEHFFISTPALKNLVENTNNIIAVGTTSLRTLESLYRIGIKIIHKKENPFHISQWEVYDMLPEIPAKEAFSAVYEHLITNQLKTLAASTQLMIVPGYKFKTAKGIITNYHQPNSALLLLIAAFVGENWRKIYNYALSNGFRFLSYGDSSLLLR